MNNNPELTQVRAGHELDESALADFLTNTLGQPVKTLQVMQFEGGQSNPTFLLTLPDQQYVLRKQPPGKLLRSAHQVDREHRVMAALADTGVPVPKMITFCEDPDIIGTPFYMMEYVEGRICPDILLPEWQPDERRSLYQHLIDIMAKLHQVDHLAVGLESFGRPGNYYTRQISRWSKQYLASKTIEIPAMDRLMAWLPEHIPVADEVSIVHGDYRIGNTIVYPSEPKIVAVLDWELSTLGHPLADLAYHCQSYHSVDYNNVGLNRPDLDELGIPNEQDQIARYCLNTGRTKIDNWNFYLVYNLFRSAAIIQGVYKRGLDGNASSTQALEYKDACVERANSGWNLVETG